MSIQCYIKHQSSSVHARTWLRKILARNRFIKKLNDASKEEREVLISEYNDIIRKPA